MIREKKEQEFPSSLDWNWEIWSGGTVEIQEVKPVNLKREWQQQRDKKWFVGCCRLHRTEGGVEERCKKEQKKFGSYAMNIEKQS